MTREELIYLGAIQLFAAFEVNPPKVGGRVLPTRGLIENEALEIAASMYGKLPKYVKYAKKLYKEDKEYNQITDEEIAE
ncbi:MAG: hypothetical protein J6X18_12500 [Bacteroidales bacterium]|nr:hypothetical protein [Bacteroidales bacterium]